MASFGSFLKQAAQARMARIAADANGAAAGVGGVPLRPNQLTGNISSGGSYMPATPDGNGAGSQNKTFGAVISAWGDFNAYQLIFLNRGATPAIVNNTCVGVGASIYPSGVNNIALPSGGWKAPIGSVTSAAGTDKQPGFFITPKAPAQSIPRAAGELDGGLYPLLYVRNYIATGNITEAYGTLPAGWMAKWNAVNEGFTLQTAPSYGVDNVTNTSGWVAAAGEDSPAFVFFGAIFHYDRKFTTVCGPGDSIWAGNGDGVTGICPFGFKATARIRRTGKYCSWQSAGINGSWMPDIAAHGKDIIKAIAPDILLLASYTINSPVAAQSDWDTQWYSLMDLVQAQLALGRQVLLVTPLPNNFLNATTNAFRVKQRLRVINSGLPYVDVESLVGANGAWANSAFVADGTHPTPAGHEALAALLQPVLNTMIP